MAWTIEHDETAYVIRQDRRRFRRTFYGMAIVGTLGMAAAYFFVKPATYDESLACDHATHACRFQVTTPLSIAESELANVRVTTQARSPHQSYITFGTPSSDGSTYQMCDTSDAAAIPGLNERVQQIAAFAADPKHAPLAMSCTATMAGFSPGAVLAELVGWLFFALILREMSREVDARFDRAERRVHVRARRWFQRPQVIDEPLSNIATIYVGHLTRYRNASPFIGMRMKDGRNVRLWTPMAGSPGPRARAKELSDWLRHGQPDETSSASSAIQP